MNDKRWILTCVLVAGCVDLDADPGSMEEPDPADATLAPCELPLRYEVLSTGHIVEEGDIIVGTVDELHADCAAGRPWRGPYARRRGTRGVGVITATWPNATVPFAIDPALPNPGRVTAAITTWQSAGTPVQFVARTTETDFINFTAGTACASPVGHIGGRQDIVLLNACTTSNVVHEIGHALGLHHEQNRIGREATVHVYWDNIQAGKSSNFAEVSTLTSQNIGAYDLSSLMHYASFDFSANGKPTLLANVPSGLPVSTTSVVDMSVASTDYVYTWWTDGTVTAGRSDDLELYRAREPYFLPNGYQISDIVGIGILKSNDNVYTYYRDGKRSIGTSTHLASVAGPTSYTVPAPYHPGNIVALDIASTGHVYAWYISGQVSSGTTLNLGLYSMNAYTLATGKNWGQVLGIGIGPTDLVTAWYSNGQTSAGTSTDLDATFGLYNFSAKRTVINNVFNLSAGDIAAINFLY